VISASEPWLESRAVEKSELQKFSVSPANIVQDMLAGGRFAQVHFEYTLVHLMLAQTQLTARHAKGQCPARRTVRRLFAGMETNRF
jgi:hypothetical protein